VLRHAPPDSDRSCPSHFALVLICLWAWVRGCTCTFAEEETSVPMRMRVHVHACLSPPAFDAASMASFSCNSASLAATFAALTSMTELWIAARSPSDMLCHQAALLSSSSAFKSMTEALQTTPPLGAKG
jgi:hypothetical protein